MRTEVCVGTGPGCAAGLSPEVRSGAKSLACDCVRTEVCAGAGTLGVWQCGMRRESRSEVGSEVEGRHFGAVRSEVPVR